MAITRISVKELVQLEGEQVAEEILRQGGRILVDRNGERNAAWKSMPEINRRVLANHSKNANPNIAGTTAIVSVFNQANYDPANKDPRAGLYFLSHQVSLDEKGLPMVEMRLARATDTVPTPAAQNAKAPAESPAPEMPVNTQEQAKAETKTKTKK